MAKAFYKYKIKLKMQEGENNSISMIVPCINMKDVRVKIIMIKKIFEKWPYDFELLDHNNVFICKLSN